MYSDGVGGGFNFDRTFRFQLANSLAPACSCFCLLTFFLLIFKPDFYFITNTTSNILIVYIKCDLMHIKRILL